MSEIVIRIDKATLAETRRGRELIKVLAGDQLPRPETLRDGWPRGKRAVTARAVALMIHALKARRLA